MILNLWLTETLIHMMTLYIDYTIQAAILKKKKNDDLSITKCNLTSSIVTFKVIKYIIVQITKYKGVTTLIIRYLEWNWKTFINNDHPFC